MSQKAVLVTGATGFIGRALVSALVKSGRRVICVVRNIKATNLPARSTIYCVSDINKETAWDVDLLQDVDLVYHLAGRAHILDDKARNPLEEFRKVNVEGTDSLARQAANAGVKRFVFISSIGVNGSSTQKEPFDEQCQPNPVTPYAVSKYEAEEKLRTISNSSTMECVIVRPPLVYGPGNPGNFMRLIKLVNTGYPLPFGAITNKRSYIYIDNLVDALLLCGIHPNAANRVWLVSDGEVLSTPQLLTLIYTSLGLNKTLFKVNPKLLSIAAKIIRRSHEMETLMNSLVVNDRNIRTDLGWQSPVSLLEGLDSTIKWYVKRNS